MGIGSLPVRLGVAGSARVACGVMLAPQAVVVACLLAWGAVGQALVLCGLMAAQALMMRRFLANPRARATWYSGFGVPLFVLGMLVSAHGLRTA